MSYYESGTPAMTRPTKAYFYDEWGMPLSSEPIYTAGPGHAAKIAAGMDANIASQKTQNYLRNPNAPVLSPGDAASAADAQSQRFGQQQDQMYNMIMAMLGYGSSSGGYGGGTGGGWTPGSTFVGGGMGGGDMIGGPSVTGGGKPPRPEAATGGGSGAVLPQNTPYMKNGQVDRSAGTSWGGGQSQRHAGAMQNARNAWTSSNRAPNPAQMQRMLANRQTQQMTIPNNLQGQTQQMWSNLGRYTVGPNGALIAPNTGQMNNALQGTAANSGNVSGGSGGAGGSGGSGLPFGQAFEQQLYNAFTKSGFDPEPIINKGTEEIASGENNTLVQLQNRAANQGIEGGAVQAGNREVLSDFAGKRSNLARDVRVEAAKDAEDKRMSALNAAGNYLGRISDNQRQDRNQMIQLMMQQMQNQQNRATDYSSLISQSGQGPSFAPILAPGGGKPGSGSSGGSTFPGQFQQGLGQGTPYSPNSFSALWGPGNNNTGVSGSGIYNPAGGLQAITHNTGRNNQAAQRRGLK